jgi:hypothetical protein
MDIHQIGSVLLQIGISALVICFLYGLYGFIEGFEEYEREQLMRLRCARRWSDQNWLTTLEELSDKRSTSLFTADSDREDWVPSMEEMQGCASADQTQEVGYWTLDRMEYSIVGETAFQRIPVGISLGEDQLR